MKRKKNKIKTTRICNECVNCVYIGEGDSICDENNEIVLEDWTPADDFLWCDGKLFKSL